MLMSDLLPKKLSPAVAWPRLERAVFVAVLVMVLAAWTLESLLVPAVTSTDLHIVATMVTKDRDPGLYRRDNLFASDELYRLYTPFYRWLVDRVWRLAGTFEGGLVWLVPPVMAAYLGAMFALVRRVTGSGWAALAVAVLSAHYHDTMGAGVWGVGQASGMMPRVLFMPLIPLLTLFFLKLLENPTWPRAAGLGLALGLAANIHPVSGLHFLALLLAWLVVSHGRTFRGWLAAAVMGLLAVIGALPVAWNYVANTNAAVDPDLKFETFSRIVAERYPVYFFPGTFRWPLLNLELSRPVLDGLAWLCLALALAALGVSLWAGRRPNLARWTWLVAGLAGLAYGHLMALFNSPLLFGIVAVYLVARFRQGPYTRLEQGLITLTGLVALYAFAGYYLLSYAWQTFELWGLTSLLIEYARAARFVYLPVYVLAGLAGAALLRYARQRWSLDGPAWSSRAALLVLVGLPLVLFGPLAGDYLPLPARNLLDASGWQAQPAAPPVDQELYDWVRQNTARDTLFYGCFGSQTMTYFRHKAQRSISHNWKDLAYNVYNRATLLPAYRHFRSLEASCQSFAGVLDAAQRLQADYIMVPQGQAAEFLQEACFVNEKYAVFSRDPAACGSNRAGGE